MATYDELYDLRANEGLRNRVGVAIAISADLIKSGADTGTDFDQTAGAHDARFAWVKNARAFIPSESLIQEVWNSMLAANNTASVATITGATDATIQTNVNQSIDILANGETA